MKVNIFKVSKFDIRQNHDKEHRIQLIDDNDCSTMCVNSKLGKQVCVFTLDNKHIRELKKKLDIYLSQTSAKNEGDDKNG